MSKWKKKLYNPVYVKETKLRVRNIKFALTILFYNLILIGIAVFGFEVLFNSDFTRESRRELSVKSSRKD